MNSTIIIRQKFPWLPQKHPTIILCTLLQQQNRTFAGSRLCLHLPLSCMTTPKCVLGVLSSGALGGTEMTGGLDGFLLEVVLFSERGKRKAGNKKNKAQQVFRAISSTKSTWNNSGCWLCNLSFPPDFRSCSGFIRVGFRFPLDNSAVTLSCVVTWSVSPI